VATMVINSQNGHFFIENEPLAAILNFQFSPTAILNFKRIPQHLQLVEREL
jgi:hypothetical protein